MNLVVKTVLLRNCFGLHKLRGFYFVRVISKQSLFRYNISTSMSHHIAQAIRRIHLLLHFLFFFLVAFKLANIINIIIIYHTASNRSSHCISFLAKMIHHFYRRLLLLLTRQHSRVTLIEHLVWGVVYSISRRSTILV